MESRPHGSQGLVGSTAGCEDCGNSVVKWEGGWGGGQGTRSQPLGTSHFQLPRLSRVAGQARIPSHSDRGRPGYWVLDTGVSHSLGQLLAYTSGFRKGGLHRPFPLSIAGSLWHSKVICKQKSDSWGSVHEARSFVGDEWPRIPFLTQKQPRHPSNMPQHLKFIICPA